MYERIEDLGHVPWELRMIRCVRSTRGGKEDVHSLEVSTDGYGNCHAVAVRARDSLRDSYATKHRSGGQAFDGNVTLVASVESLEGCRSILRRCATSLYLHCKPKSIAFIVFLDCHRIVHNTC